MSFILQNIEKKLCGSLVNKKYEIVTFSDIDNICNKKQSCLHNFKVSIIFKKLLLNFIFFFSKNLRNKKRNIKNLLIFLNFYNYYNTFFFNNKLFFYKKYFLKNNYNLFYLSKFFLNTKQVRLKPSLHRLKVKRITFFKKHIWNKNKKFRKKNILIFNKKFFKFYTSNRFNPFIADSILHFSKIKKIKILRAFRKRFFGVLNKKYYYLFLHRRYIFSKPKKRHNKNKIISYNFRYKTYAKIFVNRKFTAYRRRKVWRQVYYVRKTRRLFLRCLFLGFDSKIFNTLFFNKYKKTVNLSLLNISEYLKVYGAKLARKYSSDKNFYRRFLSKKHFGKRFRNVIYYFKWKPKIINFHSLGFLKNHKSIKKNIFSSILFKFFSKKIFWKTKKNSWSFFLLYYNNFFFNKFFLFFNSFFKAKFFFARLKKRLRKKLRLKRRRFTLYIKRLKRRVIKKKIKRKFIKFFLILLFFKLMKKHNNARKIFLLKNSLFLNKFKTIKLNLLTFLLLGKDPFYFKSNSFSQVNASGFKKNLKIICLFNKKF